ncbi:MAG: metallophosphoesterase [Deltaproteobacteria bacterium]|jgi:predicted MPP superfamily phosphohydrolase|nr:metallophosphoesterase [Deltaproteobacteria bacterium]
MFINFAIIITAYLFLSFILTLPFHLKTKLILLAVTFLFSGRIAILRYFYGGLGGIEAPKAVLFITSFLQNIAILLFVLVLIRDILWLLSFIVSKISSRNLYAYLRAPRAALTLLTLASILSLVGLIGASRVPPVVKSEVVVNRWPLALDGFKVAVMADWHISKFFDRAWVQKSVEAIMEQKPELILLPGDLVDGSVEARAPDVEPLASLKAPYGVYACMGNHEYISEALRWLPVFKRLGIDMLYNSHVVLSLRGTSLILAGVTDVTAQSRRYNLPGPDLKKALEGSPTDPVVVLLEHRPVRAKENSKNSRIILQFSGHTHGGMMPLLSSLVALSNDNYVRGWYQTGSLTLFVQPGLGLWSGFPVRLFYPNEISLLTLRSPQAVSQIKG